MAKKQRSLKKASGFRRSMRHSGSQQSDKNSSNMESEMSSQRSDDMFRKRQQQDVDTVSLGGWSLGSNLYFSDTGSGIKFNSSQEQSEENSLSIDSQGLTKKLKKGMTRSSAHHQKQPDVNRLSSNSTSDSDFLSSEADKSDKIIGEKFTWVKNVNKEMDSEENFHDEIAQTAAKNGKKRKRKISEHESHKRVFVGKANTSDVEKCKPLCGRAPQAAASKPPSTAKKCASDLKRTKTTMSKTNLQSQKRSRNDVVASVDISQSTSSSEDAKLSVTSDSTSMPKSVRMCKGRTLPDTNKKSDKSATNNCNKDLNSFKSTTELGVKEGVKVTKTQADEKGVPPSSDKELKGGDAVVDSSEVETTASPNLFEYESESSDALFLDRKEIKTVKTDAVRKEALSEKNNIFVKPIETKLTQELADAFDGNACKSPSLNLLTFEPRSSSGQSDDSEQNGKLALKDSDIENTQNISRKHYSHSKNMQKTDDKKSQSNEFENSSENSNAMSELPPLFEDNMAHLVSSSISSSRDKAKRKQKSRCSFTDSAVDATPASFVLTTRKFHKQLQTSTPMELSQNAISLAKLEFGRNVKERESLRDSGNISNFHFDSNGSFLSPVQSKSLGKVKSQTKQEQFCDKYCKSRGPAAKRQGQVQVNANSHRQGASAKQNDDGNKCQTKQYKLLKTKSESKAVEIADQTNAKKQTSKERSEETEKKRDKRNVTTGKPKSRKKARVEESSDKKLSKSSNVEPEFTEGKTTSRGPSDLVHVKSSAKNITQAKPKKISQEKAKSMKNKNLSAENKLLQELDEIDRNYSLVVGDESADLCFHD